ncbi:glycosyltransferase [Sulfurovum sp. XTW-4]|uniref:alpha-1,3-mannosyl-glycoprotein 2-beta-N-acetylglucosaminyltransferase n=1 Tax=Sulfurovum xiamenensis TaxID=3019066 RepID=A0ABT7QRK2_9BACT|nr:glycosyltransferase [Sulfurovum xiamenensis]MDM5263708.1 glycosyltransferase [Sulfurovum xiamenensis]
MKNCLAPIVIFTYRRLINQTIESLLSNELAQDSELYIFSDGSKNENDLEDVIEVRKYLQTIEGFKSIKIIESEVNKGLADSIIDGVTQVIDKYGKVIVLEDDLIVSTDFLEYMNGALNFYEKDKKIWSISGYGPKLPCLANYNDDIYLTVRGSSWGWATWKDRWNTIDWHIKDWNTFQKNKDLIEKFNLGGNDLYKMLELQMLGKIDSWAIRWCYNQFKFDSYTVYPKKSKIINDGFSDEKGTHNSGVNNKWITELDNKTITFNDTTIKKEIIECFQHYHNLSLITKIGYFLKKNTGYKIAKKFYKYLKNQ